MKTTRHSLLAKGLMVLLSLLVLVFAFTYSWFVDSHQPVTATGLSATASSSGDFDFALGFYNSQTVDAYTYTDWFDTDPVDIDLTSINDIHNNNYNLLIDYSPIDLTGSGAKLVRPAMQPGNKSIDTSTTSYTDPIPNVQYITFDIIFRTKVAGTKVYLDSGSYARGACEKTADPSNTNYTALNIGSSNVQSSTKLNDYISTSQSTSEEIAANKTTAYNVSSYGDFSRDCIVGALRVAFVGFDDEHITVSSGNQDATTNNILMNTDAYLNTTSPNLLWLPRPDIRLKPAIDSVDHTEKMTDWTLETGITHNSDSWALTSSHTYYDPATQSTKNDVTAVVNPDASQDDVITTINKKSGEYYYSKVKAVIWIEGTDTEARRAISGGKFSINFDFKGQ